MKRNMMKKQTWAIWFGTSGWSMGAGATGILQDKMGKITFDSEIEARDWIDTKCPNRTMEMKPVRVD